MRDREFRLMSVSGKERVRTGFRESMTNVFRQARCIMY